VNESLGSLYGFGSIHSDRYPTLLHFARLREKSLFYGFSSLVGLGYRSHVAQLAAEKVIDRIRGLMQDM